MKNIVFAAVLVASVAAGQYLEMVVEVPDSIGALGTPSRVLVNPVSGNCYVKKTRDVLVFDPATRARLKKLDVDGDPVLCPEVRKVYFVSDTISVVDAQADTVVRRFAIPPFHPQEAVYSPASHKVYLTAGHEGMYSMLVLDTDTDSIVNSWVMHRPWANMVWDSVPDRVMFAAGSGASTGDTCWVGAIDCRTDSVVATAPVGMSYVDELAVNVVDRKLYCRGQDDTLGTVVRLLDLDSMEVYGALEMPPPDAMQFNTTTGQLVCRDNDTLYMVDGATDSVRARAFVDGARVFCFSPVSGKVYVAAQRPDSIVVIDTSGTVVAWMDLPESDMLYPDEIGAHPIRNEVYCAMVWDTVWVVDGSADTLAGVIDYCYFDIRQMVHNPAGNKLYAFDDDNGNMLVLGPDLRLQKQLKLDDFHRRTQPVIDPTLNRLYLVYLRSMRIVDCNSDSLIDTVPMPTVTEGLCILHPNLNKLYVFPKNASGGSQVHVYDCLRDTIVRSIELPYEAEVPCACYHPRSDMIYFGCTSPPTVRVLDPQTDSIVDTLPLGHDLDVGCMLANTHQNLLYFGNSMTNVLYTVDVTDNSLVDWDTADSNLDTLFWNPQLGKLYVVDEGSSIRVLDCRSGTLGDELPFHLEDVGTMNLRNDKLYMGSDLSRQVDVMDCRHDSVVVSLPFHGTRVRAMAWNPIDNRVYASRGNQISVYRDDPVGVKEMTRMKDEGGRMSQTIVRGVLRLQNGDRPSGGVPVPALLSLVDIAGRKVMDLKTGENDVRSVAPGVYFITPHPNPLPQGEREWRSAVRKVIVNP